MPVGRPYERDRDLDAVTRIWREVGWIDPDEADEARGLRDFLDVETTLVADIAGEAECAVTRSSGVIRHLADDVPLCVIAAVTTSHVGRRQGLASALMAESLAAGAADGAAVAALGMFDQGFYDRFGFGTGVYEHRMVFDPTTMTVPVPSQPPVRLTADDADEMHALLVRRHRGHGSVVLDQPLTVASEFRWTDKPVALGYRNADGRLTSYLLGAAKGEYGPYEIEWLVYETPQDLLALLGLIRGLGDQVNLVTVFAEPPELQLQDLLRTPMRQRRAVGLAGGSIVTHDAVAEQQFRILDLRACVEATHLVAPPVSLGLRLTDPLASLDGAPWPGIGGDYTLQLGESSTLAEGLDPALPVLDASVNAFTRLWMGVRPASGLALTDTLSGPASLLDALDTALRLPTPFAGWVF
ncbi:GNAT family N-acetyltransferase [Actinospongicola halichondriae]|uniref:GNAT family N-acetyltransferase n=1 Tax=Actinospongicola halichondriae TaxID=3236844 RepID=UPI003D3F3E88